MTVHDFVFTAIDGYRLCLSAFAGKALLIVNTASDCAYTPQYGELEGLWRRYRDRGLVVLGVPSNDFGGQEPGNEDAIRAFCRSRYDVTFPMTGKEAVIGAAAHPFYRWIAEEFGEAAVPSWNFHKYLVAGDGELLEVWPCQVTPASEAIVDAIEDALGGDAS